MVTVFSISKLQELLKDFHEITGIRITVFDESFREMVSYPEEIAPYCRIIRGSSCGDEACVACDRAACAAAADRKSTYIYKCHAGFTEAVTPLYVGDVLAGFLLFGHVFSYSDREEGWQAIRQCCRALPIDHESLKEAVFGAVPISESYVKSAVRILHAVASYLILERMVFLQNEKTAVQLDTFLSRHFTENLTAASVCRSLKIGKTQLYKLSGELYGCGVSQHIRNLRMNLAKKLLTEHSDDPVVRIAEQCGYTDYNYFITVFSREVGISPGNYRKLNDPAGDGLPG